MTREEILGALNEMFPDGIPDSCNEILARDDAPFKSYQELRKAMGRSPAYTNRANWKALTAGEEGGEVVPPKPKLKFEVTATPDELSTKGSKSTLTLKVLEGEYLPGSVDFMTDFAPAVDPENNPLKMEFSAFDEETNTMTVTYTELGNADTSALLTFTAKDKNYPDTTVTATTVSVFFLAAKETKISWELSDNKLTMKGDEVFASFNVDQGEEPDQVWIDVPDDLPESQARLILTSRVEGEPRISIKCANLAEDEPVVIPLTLFSVKQGSGVPTPVNHGTKTVTVSKTIADKLEITWTQDKTEVTKNKESVMIETTVVKGQHQSGSLEVSLVDSKDLEYVTPGNKLGDNPIPLTIKKIPAVGEPDRVVKFKVVAKDENYPSKGMQQFGEVGSFTIKAEQGVEA
ncbi:hypothetical protein PR1_149 [Providencia phage vB_PreS_PR1]|uniref:Uncharacterized protein n=1 Tax=Providencia phage vB_PreS_PR1 TaxID=1931407 RepID=A0A1S6KUV8_9CAUD|nr:hypothetical protein FDH30_gp065 [Providencia phage vB_PreS_PR1]AQT25220.1 hypothetical protein PR1_149 [Providencia phage vB_PreS_PR1]